MHTLLCLLVVGALFKCRIFFPEKVILQSPKSYGAFDSQDEVAILSVKYANVELKRIVKPIHKSQGHQIPSHWIIFSNEMHFSCQQFSLALFLICPTHKWLFYVILVAKYWACMVLRVIQQPIIIIASLWSTLNFFLEDFNYSYVKQTCDNTYSQLAQACQFELTPSLAEHSVEYLFFHDVL